MSEALSLTGSDRLLIIAPHPDDESIAAGGVLQVAKAAGAAIRVLVLTDGDNNPWPQRWVEKRWRIDAAARARWGARRREEAEAALQVLGIDRSNVRFLALPDGGITDLLMRNDAAVADVLRDEVRAFAPTLLVAPSLSDTHPDHSAAFILATAACNDAGITPRILAFDVHGHAPQEDGVVVRLNPAQQQVKYDAIRAHATQMRLSDKRFLKFARAQEAYRWVLWPATPDAAHPIRATIVDGALVVRFDHSRWRTLRGYCLFVAGHVDAAPVRWQIALTPRDRVAVEDAVTGRPAFEAALQHRQREWSVRVPLGGAFGGYVKIARPRPVWWVFDRFGWQPVG